MAMVTAALAQVTSGRTAQAASLTSDVALTVWAGGEIADGANWFRRSLGVGGAALAVVGLSRDLAVVLGH
jgi:hypothetical protein